MVTASRIQLSVSNPIRQVRLCARTEWNGDFKNASCATPGPTMQERWQCTFPCQRQQAQALMLHGICSLCVCWVPAGAHVVPCLLLPCSTMQLLASILVCTIQQNLNHGK
eukprot:scpid88064/ scgid35159/ 